MSNLTLSRRTFVKAAAIAGGAAALGVEAADNLVETTKPGPQTMCTPCARPAVHALRIAGASQR